MECLPMEEDCLVCSAARWCKCLFMFCETLAYQYSKCSSYIFRTRSYRTIQFKVQNHCEVILSSIWYVLVCIGGK